MSFQASEESKAIPFIVKNHNESYCLTPQASSFLQKLEGPLTIITVAGLYRTGKSYLLNRVILNRASGFSVGPSINPCTKGLWMWAEPIRIPEGRTLLVVDTQGLGALDEQSNHDMKIFSLAVLLSTNFIYNSVGSIDETALQTLSLALQLIGNIDKDNYSSRPSLLWVIRDFSLELVTSEGKNISPNQYLEMALNTQNLKQQSKISIRNIINQAFSFRQCCTLIKPLIDEQKLQALDKIPPQQLRPEFVSQTINLRKGIINSLKEMKLNNSGPLSGKEYVLMVNKYLSAINAGEVPNLMDTWGFLKAQKARASIDIVRDNYNEKLRNKLGNRLPIPSSKLSDLLNLLRKEAIEQFLSISYQEQIHQDLQSFLNLCEIQMRRVNLKQSKNILNEMLRRQFEPFQKKLFSDYYQDISSFEKDLKHSLLQMFPDKIADKIDISDSQLELFAERKVVEASKVFERKAKQEVNRATQLKNQAQNSLQKELQKINNIASEERKKYQEQILTLEKNILAITSEKQRLEDALQNERKQEAIQAEKYRKKAEQNYGNMENMALQIQKLSSTNTEQEKIIFSLRKDLEKEKALSSQRQQYLTVKFNEQEKRLHQMSLDFEKESKIWENQRKQQIEIYEGRIKTVLSQNKQLYDQLQELTHQFQHQKYLHEQSEAEINLLKNRHQEDIIFYKQKLIHSNKKQSKKDDEQNFQKIQQLTNQLSKEQKNAKQWQYRWKQSHQQMKSIKNNCEKQIAIFNQKMEFQSLEIQQLKIKNSELNQSYHRYLQNSHSDSKGIEDVYERKILELTQQYQSTLRQTQQDYQTKITEMKKEMVELSKGKEQLELKISLQRKKGIDKQQELMQNLNKSQEYSRQLQEKIKKLEINQSSSNKQKEQFYQAKIKQLELQIEAVSEKTAQEIEDYNKKTEQNIVILKDYANLERNQWEKRLEEQKQRNNRKINHLNDEWNKKMTEERQSLQNNIQELTQKLQLTQIQANEHIQSLKCDYEIKIEKISSAAIEERMELNKKLALTIQEAQLTKASLINKLDETNKYLQQQLQTVKRQMAYEFQSQLKMVKEALQQSQRNNEALRRANRKAEESNLILKSQSDKKEAVFKEKIQNMIRERTQLEQRYLNETQSQNKIIQQMNFTHRSQTQRLNADIERLRIKVCNTEEEVMNITTQKQQQRQSLTAKIGYLESKVQRIKNDYTDLLSKFDVTVKTMSKNGKNEIEKEFQERLELMKDNYNRKILEKEESLNQERKEKDDKLVRLQTENKTLRDKLLIYEMRESNKKIKNEDFQKEMNNMQEHYERKISAMRQEIEKYGQLNRQIKQQQSMFKSKISDRSERPSQRHSFINQSPNIDTSINKGLRQNKSMLNHRALLGPTKKQQKRYLNADEVTGIMKWNH